MNIYRKEDILALVARLRSDFEFLKKERHPGSYRIDTDLESALELLYRVAQVEAIDFGELFENEKANENLIWALCEIMGDNGNRALGGAKGQPVVHVTTLLNGIPVKFSDVTKALIGQFQWAVTRKAYDVTNGIFRSLQEHMIGSLERAMKGSFRKHVERAFEKAELDLKDIHEDNRRGGWEER